LGKRAELRMVWSRREGDFVFHYDRSPQDGWLLHNLLTHGAMWVTRREGETGSADGEMVERLRAELERRGYDPNTLTISVRRRREVNRPGET
jgi:hypothetical protein